MSKDYKQMIAKVGFLIIALVLLGKIALSVFEESKNIVEKDVKVYEVSQEDIISSGREILIKSFTEEILSLQWISEDELLIEGTIDSKDDLYLFDMANKELTKYKGEITTEEKDYGDYVFIKEIPDYGDLCSLGNTIGILNASDFKEIASDASFNNEIKLVLSDDLSKMVYYHNKNNSLVTYSFKKDFYITIKKDVAESVLEEFDESIKISPEGGYVSVENRKDLIEDSTFDIYGADSGKTYAQSVMGIKLSWAPDDSRVCFYYTKETRKVKDESDILNVVSKRVGYYNVEKKELDYVDSNVSNDNMISEIYWSSDSERFTSLLGDRLDTGEITITAALEFNFEMNQFREIKLKEKENITANAKLDLIDYDNEYILVVDSKESYEIKKIQKDTSEIKEFKDLSMMTINDERYAYYYKDSDALVTANLNLITLTKANFEGFIHLEGNNYVVYPSKDLKYLVVWFKLENEIKILTSE